MAIPVPQTVGITPAVPVRPVPGLRSGIRGLVPWEEGVIPVVCLFPARGAREMIILTTRRGALALEATEILGIHPGAAVDFQGAAPPDSPHYLAGTVIIDGKSHALLDAEGVAEWVAGS